MSFDAPRTAGRRTVGSSSSCGAARRKRRPVLYSPSQKLAYLKTPKAASIAIQELFQRQFPDHVWVTTHETLPKGTLVFTFAREPVGRVIAAYAEIDVTYARRASAEKRQQMNTTFHRMATRSRSMSSGEQGARRLLAFLDDLVGQRFGGDDREHWAPTHAYPQVNFACRQRIDYVGHLENQDADWEEIQRLAGVPAARRTQIPHLHETATEDKCESGRPCMFKEDDKNVSRTPQLLLRLCETYASDFLCLGYPLPAPCAALAAPPSAPSAAAAVPPPLNRSAALPGGAADAARRLPVGFSARFDAAGAGRLRWLAKQPAYRNSLFVFRDDVANHTTRVQPTEDDPTGMQGNGDASLRPLNRLGWYLKVVDGAPLRAPLSAGVPTHDAGGRPFGPLTPAVRAHIDEALGEAQQMLLLHRYDRVLLPAELFGPAGARRAARARRPPRRGGLPAAARGRGAREPGGGAGGNRRDTVGSVRGWSGYSGCLGLTRSHQRVFRRGRRPRRELHKRHASSRVLTTTPCRSRRQCSCDESRRRLMPRVAPALVVVQPHARAACRERRNCRRGRRRRGRVQVAVSLAVRARSPSQCRRSAAAAARPASALQRSRTRAARDLGEVTASLCKDLDALAEGNTKALSGPSTGCAAVGGAAAEVAPAAPRAFDERRRAELLQLLHVVEERLGLAVSQAQHTREQAIALQDVHALLHAAERGRHAADAQLAAATAERQAAARRARAEQRVLAAALAEVEAEGDADRRAAAAARGAADARDDELRRLRAELPRLREVAEREAAARFETIGLVQQANAERDAALAELAAARAAGYAPPPAAEARRAPRARAR